MFDTPEDIGWSLEREKIHRVRRIIYTHWHPDHTMGRRVIEHLNLNLFQPGHRKVTDIWLPAWVREDFRKRLALAEHLQFFERLGIVKVHEIAQGEPLHADGVKIRAYRMAQPGLTAFLLEQGRKKIVLAVDDTKRWRPGDDLLEPDILVLEAGWFERDPRGRVIVPKGHWIRDAEASFEETLKIIERVRPKRTILTHIEELNARSYADYVRLERDYRDQHLQFAYDGLRVKV